MAKEEDRISGGGMFLIFLAVLNSNNNRSVHNVRIERLWVDITAQVGGHWADIFTELELAHGLNINNVHHIWLLHHLFLHVINSQLAFFAKSWNQHKIQIHDGPNCSPADLFGFDILVHGIRGTLLPDELSEEELEVYGVDWEGLQDDQLLHSQRINNGTSEGWTSWLGQQGPPAHLNEVSVLPPTNEMISDDHIAIINQAVAPWMGSPEVTDVIGAWSHGLAAVRSIGYAIF